MSSRRKCTDDGRVPRALAQHRRGVAQPGRAPGSGPGGRRFKSSLPDQSFQTLELHFWFSVYIDGVEIVDGGVFLDFPLGFHRELQSDIRQELAESSKQNINARSLDARAVEETVCYPQKVPQFHSELKAKEYNIPGWMKAANAYC
jgi:hypothetical protein